MTRAKLFASGRSQAVRLPKEYRFEGKEVVVKHFGKGVLLLPVEDPWQVMKDALADFEPGLRLKRPSQHQKPRPPMFGDEGE